MQIQRRKRRRSLRRLAALLLGTPAALCAGEFAARWYAEKGFGAAVASIVNFRLRQYRIAAEAAWRTGRRASVHAEAGALVGRKISFANGDDDFVESSLRPAPYVRLSLRLALGKSPI